jgi:hypothetical protein
MKDGQECPSYIKKNQRPAKSQAFGFVLRGIPVVYFAAAGGSIPGNLPFLIRSP